MNERFEMSYGHLCSEYDEVDMVTFYYNTIYENVLSFYDNGDFWFRDFEND